MLTLQHAKTADWAQTSMDHNRTGPGTGMARNPGPETPSDAISSVPWLSPLICTNPALRSSKTHHFGLESLPDEIKASICLFVDQFDLVTLARTCTALYPVATERLFRRVTVVLDADFPVCYGGNWRSYVSENGIKHMDLTLILSINRLLAFLAILRNNPLLVQQVRYFVFDKCGPVLGNDIGAVQAEFIDFFGERSTEMNFLHITFLDFVNGISKLTEFLRNPNIRNKIFKLFLTSYKDLYTPMVPPGLNNLFLMLDDLELMEVDEFDLALAPFNVLYLLFTLTCSTNTQFGLEILRKLRLDCGQKLRLRGLTIFHCHKESVGDENDVYGTAEGLFETPSLAANTSEVSMVNAELQTYLESRDKRLDFPTMEAKIDLCYLTHLYLKVDCVEHRISSCNCFGAFFTGLERFLVQNKGLPNLKSFELELFPNMEWLRPHQILENILTPLGGFIMSLSNLARLTIDFSTPGFKMFDHNMGMTSALLNKLNERLMEAFFLCFFTSKQLNTIVSSLKTLQLPDFLTSFIYYKPDFYESFLHTCKCWGCQLVLEKLEDLFFPLNDDDAQDMDHESSYYILIGFILGKLQADREVCIPIKQKTFSYKHYPIYKGLPHTLHSHFHGEDSNQSCKCNLDDVPEMTIDSLVTTYVVHQLEPIVRYLGSIFVNLDNLMIHGIYYEHDSAKRILRPIFDDDMYPEAFLKSRELDIASGTKPDMPFGYFREVQ